MRPLLLTILVLGALSGAVAAQPSPSSRQPSQGAQASAGEMAIVVRPHAARLRSWIDELDAAARRLEVPTLPPEIAEEIVIRARAILAESRQALADAEERQRRLKAQLDLLGEPTPAEGELPVLAENRRRIAEGLARAEAEGKALRLVRLQAQDIVDEAGRHQQARSAEELLTSSPSPLQPSTWPAASEQFSRLMGEVCCDPKPLALAASKAWSDSRGQLRILVYSLLALLFARFVRQILLWRARGDSRPNPVLRQSVVLLDVVPPLILAIPVAVVTRASVVQHATVWNLSEAAVVGSAKGLIAYLAISSMARALFSPRRPEWALLSIDDQTRWKIAPKIHRLALLFGFSTLAVSLIHARGGAYPELYSVFALFDLVTKGVILAAVMSAFLRPPFLESATAWSRVLPVLLVIMPAVTVLVGHARLAEEVATRLSLIILVGAGLLIVRASFQALLAKAVDSMTAKVAEKAVGGNTETGADEVATRGTGGPFLFFGNLMVDTAIFCAAIYPVLVLCNVPPTVLHAWTTALWDGVPVAGVTISVPGLLWAIGVAALTLTLARLFEQMVRERLTQHELIDGGARESILAAVRYGGVVAAIALGVTSFGLSLASVALVASALSVGIGFGLKAVVENFVAGVILLAERPIRVGDSIAVGAREGVVKRISARSTLIETVDRSMVVIPNSELMSSSVVNHTHNDRTLRLVIRVEVEPGSDPEAIRKAMLACAEGDQRLLCEPRPSASFVGFGQGTHIFELSCVVADRSQTGLVRNDLNTAVADALSKIGAKLGPPPAK